MLPARGRAHEQLEGGVGRLEVEALGLELLEPLGHLARGLAVELDAHLLGLELHGGPAGEVGHQEAGAVADPCGVDVLVGVRATRDGRGVQPRLVGERRRAHVGLGVVGRQVHQLGDVVADLGEPFHPSLGQGADAQLQRQVGDAHHQVGVAGALAVAVDGALQLRRAAEHRGDRVGDRAARVVLGVDADLHTREVGYDVGHDGLHLVGQRAAVGVAQHEHARAAHRGRLEHAQRELGVGLVAVEEVLGVEEHRQPGALQEADRIGHHRHAFVEAGAKCLGHVEVPRLADDAGGGHAGLDQGAQAVVHVDLALGPPGGAEGHERGRVELELGRGAPEERRVLGVGPGVPALDPLHAEVVELLGHPQLVVHGERDALELAAVAQRGVEDLDRRRCSPKRRLRQGHWHARPTLCSGRPGRARPGRTPRRSRRSSAPGTGSAGRRPSSPRSPRPRCRTRTSPRRRTGRCGPGRRGRRRCRGRGRWSSPSSG